MFRSTRVLCPLGLTMVLLVSLGAFPPPARGAASGEAWRVWQGVGLTGVRYEHHGNQTVTPYPVEGDEAYLESNVQSWNTSHPGMKQRFQLHTQGGSDTTYRSDDNQAQIERVQYFRESGRAAVPYRLRLGDFYAQLSEQTLERSLKGMQLEFQPDLFGPGYTSSLLLVNGVIHPNWRHLGNYTGSSHGVSWMVGGGDARVDVHYVYNRLRDTGPFQQRNQNVLGLAVADRLGWFPGAPRLEAEGNWFGGDLNFAPDRDASSFLVRLRDRPRETGWGYGFEYEDHSQFYAPAGATVNPDREILRGDLMARGEARRFKLHAEDVERAISSFNPIEEQFYSMSLEGAWSDRLGHRLYATLEDVERGTFSDNHTETLRWTLYRDCTRRLEVESGLLARLVEDRDDGVTRERTWGARWGFDYALGEALAGGGSGFLRAGVVLRKSTLRPFFTPTTSREWEPYLDFFYGAGHHTLGVRWNTVDQDRSAPGDENVTTYDGRIDYEYRLSPNHRVDFSYEFYRRDSDAVEDGESGVLSMTVKWFWGGGSSPGREGSPGTLLEG